MRFHLRFDIARGFDLSAITHLNKHKAAQIFNNLTRQRTSVGSRIEGAMNRFEAARRLTVQNRSDNVQNSLTRSRAKNCLREGKRYLCPSRGKLVEKRNRVAHATCRLTRNQCEGVVVGWQVFLFNNLLEVADDFVHRHTAELVTLAT